MRAYYDPDAPLQGREMLLELRALNLLSVFVGVRVVHVYDEVRERGGRDARVFGWAYRTLEGHVERGQMDWQVWKWLDTGEVQFRVHAVSRPASIANPSSGSASGCCAGTSARCSWTAPTGGCGH